MAAASLASFRSAKCPGVGAECGAVNCLSISKGAKDDGSRSKLFGSSFVLLANVCHVHVFIHCLALPLSFRRHILPKPLLQILGPFALAAPQPPFCPPRPSIAAGAAADVASLAAGASCALHEC